MLFYGLKLAALWWVGSTIARRMSATDWGRRAHTRKRGQRVHVHSEHDLADRTDGLGLASLAAGWRESNDAVARMLEFCIVVTGVVLASPHTQRRYYVALYVPVVALVTLWSHARPALNRRRLLVCLLATSVPATLLPLVFVGHRLALIYEACSPYTFGAIVLFGILVALTLERKAGVLPERRSVDPTDAAGNLPMKIGV